MPYIYPKYSKYELFGIRFSGAGLGNLLFMWSRAIVAAKEHGCELIWPTWPSIKIGPWIRREKDKRLYADLFRNRVKMISGVKKYKMLLFSKKTYCRNYNEVKWSDIHDGDLIVCTGYGLKPGELQMNFDGLREYRKEIAEIIQGCLASKGRSALGFNANQSINVHVRLGDFNAVNVQALAQGINNTRIGISWYISAVKKIREAAGWQVPVNIFSDGTDEELKDLLSLPDVKRVFFGNSIADIIALSKAPLMIASGSSFSLWARFLGNCSSISYPNQMKDKTLSGETGFEIELSEAAELPERIKIHIYNTYG